MLTTLSLARDLIIEEIVVNVHESVLGLTVLVKLVAAFLVYLVVAFLKEYCVIQISPSNELKCFVCYLAIQEIPSVRLLQHGLTVWY